MSIVVDFNLAKCADAQGRFIDDIWAFNLFWLEHDHDYIQWLFPIDSPSRFSSTAPVLSDADRGEFKHSLELAEALQKSLQVMLVFFGMDWHNQIIQPSNNLNIKEHIWLKHSGHNHLRISRIIRSLALCGQTELSEQFCSAMLSAAETHGQVNDESKIYWVNAGKI